MKQVLTYFISRRIIRTIALLFLSISLHAHPAPVVNYVVSPFCYGDTAYFSNLTTRANDYVWNIYQQDAVYDTLFNLIYTTTDTNLKFRFPFKRKYQVELIGNNGHTTIVNRTIKIDSVIYSGFSYHDCLSQFSNLSVCYSSCLWNFGDGKSSTLFSPVHYYSSSGKYKVTLTVYNGNQTNTYSDSVSVYSLNTLDGGFTYKPNKDSVFFQANDSISGGFTEYHWTFGDGTVINSYAISGGRKVYHSFAKKDTTYTVFLLVRSLCIASYSTKNIFIPDPVPVTKTMVYPNPFETNIIHIATERKTDLSKIIITDLLGRQSNNISVTETFKGYDIDTGDLPKSLYILTLYFGNEVKRFQLVKK